ncbi:MAG: hypothetical protein MUF79_06365 [Burkholderiales bacterium]|jgi:hypothetical protein|nr:hypothetical protein [Burkholderiales bacterium]
MSEPTVASRRRRRFVLMTSDEGLATALAAALPEGWEMERTANLDALGGFAEILQFRFLLLDLDDYEAFDPLDVIRHVRMDLMLNLAVFCFGGAADVRNEARLQRADRFFERGEMVDRMRQFCEQYGWG